MNNEYNVTNIDSIINARSYTGQPNATEIKVGDLNIWKSYDTTIGFKWKGHNIPGIINKNDMFVVSNTYSTTTNRHQNHIDGGTQNAKQKRQEKKTFDLLLGGLLKAINIIDKNMKIGE